MVNILMRLRTIAFILSSCTVKVYLKNTIKRYVSINADKIKPQGDIVNHL